MTIKFNEVILINEEEANNLCKAYVIANDTATDSKDAEHKKIARKLTKALAEFWNILELEQKGS